MGLRVPAASMKWLEKPAKDIGATRVIMTVLPRCHTLPPAAEDIPLVMTGPLVKAARRKSKRGRADAVGGNPVSPFRTIARGRADTTGVTPVSPFRTTN